MAREAADSAEPTEAAEPTEKAEANDPTEPTESAEPTEPTESTEPVRADREQRVPRPQREPRPVALSVSFIDAVSQPRSSRRCRPVPDPALPIAVFDSGVGGLTVLHECLVSLPEEDYLYLGDDARFPYGAKTAEELRRCVERNIALPARARREADHDRLQLGCRRPGSTPPARSPPSAGSRSSP